MMAKQASSGPRKLKFSPRKGIRVIHIGNPRMVKTSPSEFSAVVQSLTGLKKRQSPPPSSKEVDWDCEERESSKPKAPRHEGEFQFGSIIGIHETEVLPRIAQESDNKYGGVDQEEMFEMVANHKMSTLDCFDGKLFPDIFSFDFMSSTSDVV